MRTIDDSVTDSSPPLALRPSDGVGEEDQAVLSTSDIEALASSLNLEDNLPQWYIPTVGIAYHVVSLSEVQILCRYKLDCGRSLSESLTTVSSMSNISLLQW